MTDVRESCASRSTSAFYPIWSVNADVKHQVIRFVCTLLGVLLTLYCTCMLSVVADSFYVPGEQPPLPDRIHDQLLHRRVMPHWLPHLVDACTAIVVFGTAFRCLFLLPFPLNLQVVSRLCTLEILVLWMRSAAVLVTTLPPSKPICIPHVPKDVHDLLTTAFRQASDHNQECTGMIISGHSIHMMLGVMCFHFYGRCTSAPEKKGSKGCCRRGVTWGNSEAYDTLRGCFLYQCIAFVKLWVHLKRSGAESPLATAAARCFAPVPIVGPPCSPPASKGGPRRGPFKTLWGAVTRLPLWRYLCYTSAITGWIVIPLCYNHYTVDVYLALLLGVLCWFVYHLILTIEIVHKRGASGLQSMGTAVASGEPTTPVRSNSLSPPPEGWADGASPAVAASHRGVSSKGGSVLPSSESAGAGDEEAHARGKGTKAAAAELQLDACMQRETTPGSDPSIVAVGREGQQQQHVVQVTAAADREDSTGGSLVPACGASSAFAAEFETLHLEWILDFPVLKPISWCIRKLEALLRGSPPVASSSRTNALPSLAQAGHAARVTDALFRGPGKRKTT
ncbi:hypothetical protein Esti_004246 [Eimeria stiedai]